MLRLAPVGLCEDGQFLVGFAANAMRETAHSEPPVWPEPRAHGLGARLRRALDSSLCEVEQDKMLVLITAPASSEACKKRQARINFAIVRAVLASIHCSEMKKTHGWQCLKDDFLALVVQLFTAVSTTTKIPESALYNPLVLCSTPFLILN
uniref:Uncharacterized protein n=1 Tax=Oryza meridionalis TaxID=40149 RepID=A0A0E0BYB2_9ORYZ